MSCEEKSPNVKTPENVQPWPEKGKERAKQLWSLLRNSVKLTTDLVKKADVQPSTVSHGVHHMRKINHDETIYDVVYNPASQEIVTLDDQFIRIFHKDGRRKDIIDTGESLGKLVFCVHSNQYVGLSKCEEMKLFNPDFELVSTAKCQHRINCMLYNESTSEVITAGPGNLTTWCFRYGNRYMIPHKSVTDGLTCRDEFDKLTLENTASHSQRCYAVCGTAVAVFNLHDAVLLSYQKDLHVRNITSILFFNPLKYIVTGSRDGSIKLWDEHFGIKLVFVGHHGPVTSLNLYPQGPFIMSSSQDCSIRVWSMETCDEVDLIKMDDPILGLGSTPRHSTLFSFTNYSVDLWTITHVHQIFSSIGNPVQKIKTTLYAQLVNRVVCLNEDGMVQLISPVDGSVLTSLPPPANQSLVVPAIDQSKSRSPRSSTTPVEKKFILDAVYCLPLETIFAAYSGGDLIKASSISNPAMVINTWTYNKGWNPCCLCMYEYILNIVELKAKWKEVKEAKVPIKTRKTRIPQYGNKLLLLAGCSDGYIASLDMDNGKVLYKTEAHGAKGVIGLLANVRDDQVISAGQDNVVKIWRIFPNTKESMGLLMSFYCAHTPRHMTICGSKLAVAFQQLATATYTMVVYDLQSKKRSDHSPDQDHTDELTGLACCPRLKLFASSSRDGTVRVWDDDNHLVRILKINDEPLSLDFCNQKGDILIGLGKNVHRVDHTDYLPRIYIFKMVCMQFVDAEAEQPLPLNQKLLSQCDEKVVRRIMAAKSSFMRMDYEWDPMSPEEQQKLSEERIGRMGEYALLLQRESDMARIRDGELKPKRASRQPSKRTESIAFKKYMALFWDRPKKVHIADEDDFDPDPHPVREPTPQEWLPERKIGFFPPIDAARPVQQILEEDGLEKEKHLTDSGPDYDPKGKYIVNPCGFIPNSILVKLLWPQSEVKKLAEDIWKPPTLSDEQLQMIADMEKKAKEKQSYLKEVTIITPVVSRGIVSDIKLQAESEFEDEEDGVLFLDSGSESVGDLDDFDFSESMDPSAGKPAVAKRKASIAKKSKRTIEKKPSALMEKMRSAMRTPSPPPKEPTPPPTPPPAPEPKVKAPSRPSKPLVKFVTRPPPPKAPTPPAPTPPPPTPPPPTPPPNYLTQFQGLTWYERHKEYINQRLTKPYTVSQFFKVVCDVMGISIDWMHRMGIADALLLLWQQEDLREGRHLVAVLGSILNASVPPSPLDSDQVLFLRSAVKLYQTANGGSQEFLIELFTQYLQGDQVYKNFVRNTLIDLGLHDPHVYLSKELDSWEIWNLDDTKPLKAQLREMVERWFGDWRMRFQNHLEQTIEQLRRGDIKGKIRRSGQSKTSEGKRVKFAVQPTEASLQNITPIEVVNYFCELTLEEEMERVRLANVKPEPTKNTVLVLPKIEGPHAIVRLGEMHTAKRMRKRQELAFEYRVDPLVRPYPDLMASFTNKLNLPLSRVPLNPFPCNIDQFDDSTGLYQPVLITLRSNSHQKYFIPEKSFVHMAY